MQPELVRPVVQVPARDPTVVVHLWPPCAEDPLRLLPQELKETAPVVVQPVEQLLCLLHAHARMEREPRTATDHKRPLVERQYQELERVCSPEV